MWHDVMWSTGWRGYAIRKNRLLPLQLSAKYQEEFEKCVQQAEKLIALNAECDKVKDSLNEAENNALKLDLELQTNHVSKFSCSPVQATT